MRKHCHFLPACLIYVLALAGAAPVSAQKPPARGANAIARIPFSFERNEGQVADRDADWLVHSDRYRILIGAAGATVQPLASAQHGIRMVFSHSRAGAESSALDPLPGRVNYLIGPDPRRWVRDVPTFRKVLYRDVYDGVDVSWYGSEGRLEYDFVVHPGADTRRIGLRIEGARRLALEPGGDLRIETSDGPLTLRAPSVYQESSGARQRIESGYVLRADSEVGLALGAYDRSRVLTIDPTLVYAGWFYAQSASVTALARDPQGNLYVGGNALGLMTVNAFQAGTEGQSSPFVIKLDPTGATMLYATFVGGGNLIGLAVDSNGYAVGTGAGPNFPLVNPAQSYLHQW